MRAQLIGEDQVSAPLELASLQACLALTGFVAAKDIGKVHVERNRSSAAVRLHRPHDLLLRVQPLQLLLERDRIPGLVDVAPPQPEQLTQSQPVDSFMEVLAGTDISALHGRQI
jgi:hypothetical protein